MWLFIIILMLLLVLGCGEGMITPTTFSSVAAVKGNICYVSVLSKIYISLAYPNSI
jgi:hypothetical protein